MNRIFYTILFLFIQASVFAQNETFNDPWKYNTIAHELLKMEEEAFEQSSINYNDMYKVIDSLIDWSSHKINLIKEEDFLDEEIKALKILKTIDETFTEFNFLTYYRIERLNQALVKVKIKREMLKFYSEKDKRKNNETTYYFDYYRHSDTESGVICMTENRMKHFNSSKSEYFYRSDCDLTGFIYLGIAQVNDLPIFLVEVPGHNFVRYQINDNSFINWDNNSANTFSNDDFRKGLSPTTSTTFNLDNEKKNHYLKNMTLTEVIGYHYENVARYSIENSKYEMAIEQYKLALKNRPYTNYSSENLASLYHLLGYNQIKEGKFKESMINFKKALEINDTIQYANDNLGYVLIRLKKLEDGRAFIKKSMNIGNNDPSYTYRNLALYHFYKKDFYNTEKYFLKAFENADSTVDLLDFHYAEFLIAIGKITDAMKHFKIAAANNEMEAIKKIKEFEKN